MKFILQLRRKVYGLAAILIQECPHFQMLQTIPSDNQREYFLIHLIQMKSGYPALEME